MYNEQLEQLIDAALTDGVLTDKEKQVLFKKAKALGIDQDEFEMVLDARLAKAKPTLAANEKMGNIATCPNCGAQIPGGLAKCPECGYEFRNVEGNRSAKQFCKELEDLQSRIGKLSEEQQQTQIQNFFALYPVPNTTEDLLEFLSLVQGPAKRHNMNDNNKSDSAFMENSYWNLYSKCISKAKITFSSDARFIPYIESYEKAKKKMTPETIKNIIIFGLCFGLPIISSVLGIIFCE